MKWSGWRPYQTQGESLYADWFRHLGGDQASNLLQVFQPAPSPNPVSPFDPDVLSKITSPLILSALGSRFEPHEVPVGSTTPEPSHTLEKIRREFGELAWPKFAANKKFDPEKPLFAEDDRLLPELKDAELLEPDTVIVGIIDTDIALSHHRTRLAEGGTRFLAAWQQSGIPKSDVRANAANLPFGRELLAEEIDSLLEEHSVGGKKDGWLDEEAFNRAAGLTDFRNVFGNRSLSGRFAHGTHVLDRAAGYDAIEDDVRAEKIRLIAINLPSREIVGLSGSFLELYVAMGIARIVELANGFARWAEKKEKPGPKWGRHYPVIINFSFGKQAGPRDGTTGLIERLVERVNKRRGVSDGYVDKGNIFLSMPAGNDNLLRGNAVVTLKPGEERTLCWQILPEDQSSNYVEIWSDEFADSETDSEVAALDQLEIAIELSDRTTWNADRIADIEQTKTGLLINEINKRFRVYCKLTKGGGNKIRIHYLICTAPTLVQNSEAEAAPAGLTRIKLKNNRQQRMPVFVNVQTDQSAIPNGITGLRSYFEDKSYELFDETTGRPNDTYLYPENERSLAERATRKEGYPGNDKDESLIKRHGTLNALAIDRNYSIVTGGYRATDGAPSNYSASGGAGVVKRIGDYMGAPTLAAVTDDGPAHPGILSAGARDGSAVAMRGTSFAAPQITRKLAELLVPRTTEEEGETRLNPKRWISIQSSEEHGTIRRNEKKVRSGKSEVSHIAEADLDRRKKADIEKVGQGRFPPSHYRGLNRLGLETDD